MAARRPFWNWHRWKSIGFCLWPPSTCIWNLKLKFQSKLDLCSGNHVVYRQTDGQTDRRTDKVNPVYPPSNFVGRGYKYLELGPDRGISIFVDGSKVIAQMSTIHVAWLHSDRKHGKWYHKYSFHLIFTFYCDRDTLVVYWVPIIAFQ